MSATNRGASRNDADRYPTPTKYVDTLFERIIWSDVKTFLEPCAGTGRIYNRVPKNVQRSWCELHPGKKRKPRNYLQAQFDDPFDLIITNPPFTLARPFIDKALNDAGTVIMLLRLNFWGSLDRCDWWNTIEPVTHQLAIVPRPSFTGKGTDACEYAWICWDRNNLLSVDVPFYVLSSATPRKVR